MNFNIPVVVSDLTGCADDLGSSTAGIVYKTGNIQGLKDSIEYVFNHIESINSTSCINDYSYEQITR